MDNGGITPVVNLNPTTPTYSMPFMPYNYGGGFGGGFGDGSWIFLFAILALFGLGGNGFGFGGNGFANAIGYENLATSNEVQRGFDNQNATANQREILGAVTSGTAQSIAATNQTFHDTVSVLSDKYSELQRDIAGLAVGQANALANQNACCCETKMQLADVASTINANIAQSRYDAALNTEKILSAMAKDKIETLQNRINSLELAQATANTVKYPNSFVYASPANPFCNTGCGCGCNNF